jgi:PAS domain S-box-containing protein
MTTHARRILCAEDSPTQAEYLRLLLESEGYVVEIVANGREGLERLQTVHPDLIISDIVMPEVDGFAFCQAVKADPRTRHIPFVILTSLSTRDDIVRGLELGADNFITKPFEDEYLLERVRRIFSNIELGRQRAALAAHTVSVGDRAISVFADKRQLVEFSIASIESLAKSEARSRAILSAIPDTMLRLDHDGVCLEAKVAPGYGLPLDAGALAGQPVDALFPAEVARRFREQIAQALANGVVPPFLYHLRLDDVTREYEARLMVSGPDEVLVIVRDTTAHRQAQEALLHLTQRLESILAGAGEGIYGLDRHGRATFVNPAAAKLLGYEVTELIAQPLHELARHARADGTPLPAECCPLCAVARDGTPQASGEAVFTRKDGTVFPVEYVATPLHEHGQPAGAVVVFMDISERKRAEAERARLQQAIAEEHAVLTSVLASMTDGLVMLDGEHRVRYANAQAAALLGIDAAAMVGLAGDAVFAEIARRCSTPAQVLAARQHALAHLDERPAIELSLEGPPRRELVASYFPIAWAGPLPAYGVLLHDVTAERELARAKDALVSIVSHDLRTPLASIVGFAELLLTRPFGEAQRREFLTIMLQEGQRLATLINDFLDIQHLESGRVQLALAPTDLGPLLAQCVAAAGDDPARPIVLELPPDLPPVQADAARIQQVVTNLLSNARKYSPQGGTIRVAARQQEGWVAVAVADQGLGLPPEALPRLFEKFYRVDSPDRREIQGTGLGLAIVRQIVEAHGGQVHAESPGLNQGTTFTFTLPVAVPGAAGGQVLVIEDDVAFARLLEAELAGRGLTAVRVPSAEEALACFDAVRPRAVLLDLLLPGLPGEAWLRRLRETHAERVPVVVVTVRDLDAAERAALAELGVVAVLRKGPGVAPAAIGALRRAIEGPPTSVLVVDDEPEVRAVLGRVVQRAGYATVEAAGPEEALAILEADLSIGLILTDVRMPTHTEGVVFIREVRRRWPHLPLAAVTGWPDDLALLQEADERPSVTVPKPFRPAQIQEILRLTVGAGQR